MDAKPRCGWQGQRGFTLLETMVAFIIVSFAVVALVRGGGDGLGNVVVAGQTEKALALAQARLSAFAAEAEPAGEELQGDDAGGFHWRLLATPVDSLPLRGPARRLQEKTTLYRLSATVSWADGRRRRSVTLDTQRLTPLSPLLPP